MSKARTVSLDSVLLEVPLGYSGRKIELRYNTTSDVEALFVCRCQVGNALDKDFIQMSTEVHTRWT